MCLFVLVVYGGNKYNSNINNRSIRRNQVGGTKLVSRRGIPVKAYPSVSPCLPTMDVGVVLDFQPGTCMVTMETVVATWHGNHNDIFNQFAT